MTLTRKGQEFTTGSARFHDSASNHLEPGSKVFVRFRIAHLEHEFLGLLDTGATWSIVDWEIAVLAGLRPESGHRIRYSGRWGTIEGSVVTCSFLLPASEGEPLEIQGSVFVSTDWRAGNFIGYRGLLERIRFALDPQENRFYFGPCA
ncbi:MAG TPA: hypothetical protein VN851_17295 [Thermoanaerobaculia bacterium]|nr:hypothetical protein [Thermoanaerobaculia bacterium]